MAEFAARMVFGRDMQAGQLSTLRNPAVVEMAPAADLSRSRVCSWLFVCLLFALNMALVSSVFLPNLRDITGFAEAAYINNGRKVIQGELTPFGYSPLSSLLYALTYIPVRESPYWLIYSCTIGRILLFALLWASSYAIATTFAGLASPLVMIGLLAISPALLYLVAHGSHALFAAMSAFALWQVLLLYQSKATRHLIIASVFVGLAVLSRSGEGLFLWMVLILLAVWLHRDSKRLSLSLAASLCPCAIILGGYILLYYGQVGRFDLGMAEYSYFTFEQGHGLAYQSRYDQRENFYVNGQVDARRLFGTPEENNYSIATAIYRNPSAYLQRVPRLVALAPSYAIREYGGSLGLIFFLLAVRGLIDLAHQKLYTLLSILFLWCSYFLTYLLLVFQATHFLFPYYIVFVLTSIGLTAAIRNISSRKEISLWCAVFVGLIITGIAAKHVVFFSTCLFFLLAFTTVWTVMNRWRRVESITAIGIILALAAFAIRAEYPQPKFRQLGIAVDEQATLFMKQHLKPRTPVGAYAPINVWMADLTYIPMFRSALPEIASVQDLLDWMKKNHLAGVYVDPHLQRQEPSLWAIVEGQIGKSLKVGFTSEKGEVQVLLANTEGPPADLTGYVERPWFSSKERFVSRPAAE
jgi:hypothetical protein